MNSFITPVVIYFVLFYFKINRIFVFKRKRVRDNVDERGMIKVLFKKKKN